MPENGINLFDKRQVALLLFTLQLIIHSSNKVEVLQKVIKEEIEKKKAAPEEPKKAPEKEQNISQEGQNPPESENIIQRPEYKGMIKSILSQAPPTRNKFNPLYQKQKLTVPPQQISAVKPVQVKTTRVEMPLPPKHPAQVLRVPEPKLPPEFQYLRPAPVAKDIDLGKLNVLINDPGVQVIECQGPDKPIIVSGIMGRKPSEIVFSNEEVEDIVSRFSAASKIPAEQGIYKVALGRLIFSAVISDVVPSRFTIRKMRLPNPVMQINRNPNQRPQLNRNPNQRPQLMFRR